MNHREDHRRRDTSIHIFSQMLQLFSRSEFERAVAEHQAERHARGFSCWGQFVAMLFCHLGRAQSLREICGGLAASEGKLRHLGLPDAPRRSTLAYANCSNATSDCVFMSVGDCLPRHVSMNLALLSIAYREAHGSTNARTLTPRPSQPLCCRGPSCFVVSLGSLSRQLAVLFDH